MVVKVINKSAHSLPDYATLFSAGMDLRANLKETVLLRPLQRVLIPTGITVEIPHGYEGQIRPRSGLASKYGITVLNSPGTIDADYRGEIQVILINLSNEDYIVQNGERIAQFVLAKYERIEWQEVSELEESDRGEKGFGSSGRL